jgi:ATP-dependent RNA helicase DHX36
VQPGVCYRLYPRPLHEALEPYGVPELQRVPLEELCLQILHLGLGGECSAGEARAYHCVGWG